MSNRRNLPGGGRREPRHAVGGRHRTPPRAITGLAALPGQAGTRLLAAGALGSAAVMALHGAAGVADADGQAAPAQTGVRAASLTASVTSPPVIYYKAPPAPGTVLPRIPLPQPRPSSAPQIPPPVPDPFRTIQPDTAPAPQTPPAADTSAPGPSAAANAPVQDQFGAGAQPVQLYEGLTAVPPSMLSQIGNALANGSVSVSASRYPFFGFLGGTVGVTVGADGGAVQLGAGAGMGGDVKVGIADTPPTTNPSLQITGQVTDGIYLPGATSPVASFKGQAAYTILGQSGASATGQLSVGNWQVSQTTPLGGSNGPGPNTGDQGGQGGGAGAQSAAYKLQSFGSQTSVQVMATVPFTWQDLVRGVVTGAGLYAGLTPEQAQQAALRAWPDPTPQQMIDRDFAGLAAAGYPVQTGTMPVPAGTDAPAVPYLYLNTPDGPLNPLTGSVGTPGQPVNPITGVPDSVAGNTGSLSLPWPVIAPAPPEQAADPAQGGDPAQGSDPAQTAQTDQPATDQLVTVTDATDSGTISAGSSISS